MKEEPKPLYLHGGEPLHVSLDGPALRVRKQRSDDRRFPLERISRVVVFGSANWAWEARLACEDSGIVVCFLREDGLPCGQWIGKPSSRSTFSEDWRHFLEGEGSRDLFRQWRVGVRRRAIRLCAFFLRRGQRDARALVVQAGRCSTSHPTFRMAKRGLYGLARARSLEELSKLGLSEADKSLCVVVPVLAMAIQWGLHPALCDWWPCQSTVTTANLTAFFERNRSTVEFHLRDVLRCLARFLGEHM